MTHDFNPEEKTAIKMLVVAYQAFQEYCAEKEPSQRTKKDWGTIGQWGWMLSRAQYECGLEIMPSTTLDSIIKSSEDHSNV